jgi:hypothetical protein
VHERTPHEEVRNMSQTTTTHHARKMGAPSTPFPADDTGHLVVFKQTDQLDRVFLPSRGLKTSSLFTDAGASSLSHSSQLPHLLVHFTHFVSENANIKPNRKWGLKLRWWSSKQLRHFVSKHDGSPASVLCNGSSILRISNSELLSPPPPPPKPSNLQLTLPVRAPEICFMNVRIYIQSTDN